MPVLTTARLTCSPLQADWPFFLALQQHPDVMRFVAEDRPLQTIREAFDSRLAPWTPGSAHWLCLVVRDAASQAPLGVTGYIHREEDCAEVGFLFAPARRGKVTALNPCGRFAITPLTRAVYVGSPPPSRRAISPQGFTGKIRFQSGRRTARKLLPFRTLAK
jgi:hypothetical protein